MARGFWAGKVVGKKVSMARLKEFDINFVSEKTEKLREGGSNNEKRLD